MEKTSVKCEWEWKGHGAGMRSARVLFGIR